MPCLDDPLFLRLGLAPPPSNPQPKPLCNSSFKFDAHLSSSGAPLQPSLSLGLPGDPINSVVDVWRQGSPPSAVSSFSGGRVKRERDVAGDQENEEAERVSSRMSEEDEDGANARKKLRLNKEQSAVLEESFKQNSTLNPKQKQALARQLNLRPRQVEVWFQNRRARTKLKQTEVDCEFLKKCCETLTDENRRLQKELQDLKALKSAQPFYMHMPPATLTMCPSCETVGGGIPDGSAKFRSPTLLQHVN